MRTNVFFFIAALFFARSGWAKFEYKEAPSSEAVRTGKAVAKKFFQPESAPDGDSSSSGSGGPVGSRDHYLALHLGGFTSSRAYKWGGDIPEDSIAKFNLGVTYRLGEWTSLMDLVARVDFTAYEVTGQRARKLSLMPGFIFPEANSKFPIYFGAAAGIGIFFEQLRDESSVALDYQLLAGLRFFDIFERVGFLLETGMKNHLLLLSDGQLNSVFLTIGSVFTF